MGVLAFFGLSFLIAAPFSRAAEASWCHMDWFPYGGYCYKLFSNKLTWAEAEVACQYYFPYGHLASIHSIHQSAVLAEYIMKYHKDGTSVWIGLHDPLKNRQWRWTDWSSNRYKNWNAGEPNNNNNNENCVELWADTGYLKWNDENCRSDRPYLCQYRR
ncbi:C-type lectin lectoxin-Thr1-like [Zootoca vivipara]|uniref:C-type lectin lectoxin-Thr1-like n=1 Tax=Zootoca vivipara TaxID=8524 RepID=UPI00293BAD68|nr:C-type lectin lectoxin-Thr1-like [Zootoca vivipara]